MKKILIITTILFFIAMPCFAGFFSNDDDCPPSPPDPDPPPSPCDMAPIVPAPVFK